MPTQPMSAWKYGLVWAAGTALAICVVVAAVVLATPSVSWSTAQWIKIVAQGTTVCVLLGAAKGWLRSRDRSSSSAR